MLPNIQIFKHKEIKYLLWVHQVTTFCNLNPPFTVSRWCSSRAKKDLSVLLLWLFSKGTVIAVRIKKTLQNTECQLNLLYQAKLELEINWEGRTKKKKREFRPTSQNDWSLKLCALYKFSLKLFTDTNKTCSLLYCRCCPHWKKIKQKPLPEQPVPCSLRTLTPRDDWSLDTANPRASLSGPPTQIQRTRRRMALASCAAELTGVSPEAAAGRIPELSCCNYSGVFPGILSKQTTWKTTLSLQAKIYV